MKDDGKNWDMRFKAQAFELYVFFMYLFYLYTAILIL